MSPASESFEVRRLADVPAALPLLEEWFCREWVPYYGPGGPGDAAADLRECCQRDRLPIGLVALSGDGTVLGTIALKSSSISHRHLHPWAAAFLVGENYRNRGIGTALLMAVEEEARRLGHDSLFISTDSATGLVERLGWRRIDEADSLRGPVAVYEKQLRRVAPSSG